MFRKTWPVPGFASLSKFAYGLAIEDFSFGDGADGAA
jgi:hypothetical protein